MSHNSMISAFGFGFDFMWRLSVNGSFLVQPGHAWDEPSFAKEPNQHFLQTRWATLPCCLRHLLGTNEFLMLVNFRHILHRGGGSLVVRALFLGGIMFLVFWPSFFLPRDLRVTWQVTKNKMKINFSLVLCFAFSVCMYVRKDWVLTRVTYGEYQNLIYGHDNSWWHYFVSHDKLQKIKWK